MANKNNVDKKAAEIKKAREGKKDKNWIQKAIKKPGALSKTLGVPEDKNIPMEKLKKAAKTGSPKTKKRANLAITLRKCAKKKGVSDDWL